MATDNSIEEILAKCSPQVRPLAEALRRLVREAAPEAEERGIKRLEYPDDLVGAVIFIPSEDSDFVTGQTLVVDGGRVMH